MCFTRLTNGPSGFYFEMEGANMDDDEPIRGNRPHEVGMVLEAMSVDELSERIEVLRREIERLEVEINKKSASRSAAENVFK